MDTNKETGATMKGKFIKSSILKSYRISDNDGKAKRKPEFNSIINVNEISSFKATQANMTAGMFDEEKSSDIIEYRIQFMCTNRQYEVWYYGEDVIARDHDMEMLMNQLSE